MKNFPGQGWLLCVLAVPLMCAGLARAVDPDNGISTWFAEPAAPVALVTMPQAPAIMAQDPRFEAVAQLIAQQAAMMQQMMQQMSAPFPVMSPPGTGSSVVVTSMGGCTEVVTTSFSADDGRPLLSVRRVGPACGELPQSRVMPADAPAVPPGRLDINRRTPGRPIYRS